MGERASIGSRTWKFMSTRSAGYSWTQELDGVTWAWFLHCWTQRPSHQLPSVLHISVLHIRQCHVVAWTLRVGSGKGSTVLPVHPAKVLGLHRPELAGATCPSAHGRMDRPNCPGCFMADFCASRVKQPLVNLKDGRWKTPHTV